MARRKVIGFYTKDGKVRPITAPPGKRKRRIRVKPTTYKRKMKIFEFDVYIPPKPGEKPEKIGYDMIPAYSLEEARYFLRTVKSDEPRILVFKEAKPLSHFDSDSQRDYKSYYRWLKKAAEHSEGLKGR